MWGLQVETVLGTGRDWEEGEAAEGRSQSTLVPRVPAEECGDVMCRTPEVHRQQERRQDQEEAAATLPEEGSAEGSDCILLSSGIVFNTGNETLCPRLTEPRTPD